MLSKHNYVISKKETKTGPCYSQRRLTLHCNVSAHILTYLSSSSPMGHKASTVHTW